MEATSPGQRQVESKITDDASSNNGSNENNKMASRTSEINENVKVASHTSVSVQQMESKDDNDDTSLNKVIEENRNIRENSDIEEGDKGENCGIGKNGDKGGRH
mmetsp:Transcript_34898/g.42686  ORF Transcript_34898/g.42686 Transcript_34898/m.42686 type:complete len:104 (-) Transcript_34898:70-381(-)